MSKKVDWYWDEIGLRSGLLDVDKLVDLKVTNISTVVGKEIESWLGIDKDKCKVEIVHGDFGLSQGDLDKDPADHYKGQFSVQRRRGGPIVNDAEFFTWVADYPEDKETIIMEMEVFLQGDQVDKIKNACGISKNIEKVIE